MRGNLAAAQLCRVASVHEHLAARRALEQGDQPEHRALAGAGMAGQEGHLAGLELERKFGQGLAPVGISLEDPVELDHGVPAATGRSSPSTKARASKIPKSSACSPTPTKRIGSPKRRAIATTTPPLAVPS